MTPHRLRIPLQVVDKSLAFIENPRQLTSGLDPNMPRRGFPMNANDYPFKCCRHAGYDCITPVYRNRVDEPGGADASKIGFLRSPKGLKSGLHPAPAKQFVMVLTGLMEVESGDGERRQFLPGSVLLVTDTQGSGHRTSVLGDQDVFLAWVPIP